MPNTIIVANISEKFSRRRLLGPPLRSSRSTSALTAAAISVLAGIALSACGGSSDSTAASASSVQGATYELVPDAQVTAGLGEVTTMLAGLPVLLATGDAEGRAGIEAMYTKWFEFEGTIRANDKDLYLAMEDGLVAAKIGVQENRPNKIDQGIVEFGDAATAYIKAHP